MNKSNTERLFERMNRYPSESKLMMMRNVSYGASGVCLALIGLLLQVRASSPSLLTALYGAVAAMPLWLCLGGLYEHYIALGTKSHAHFRSKLSQNIMGALGGFGSLGLLAAVSGVLVHLSVLASALFGVTSFASVVIYFIFHNHIANWYFNNGDADDQAPGK